MHPLNESSFANNPSTAHEFNGNTMQSQLQIMHQVNETSIANNPSTEDKFVQQQSLQLTKQLNDYERRMIHFKKGTTLYKKKLNNVKKKYMNIMAKIYAFNGNTMQPQLQIMHQVNETSIANNPSTEDKFVQQQSLPRQNQQLIKQRNYYKNRMIHYKHGITLYKAEISRFETACIDILARIENQIFSPISLKDYLLQKKTILNMAGIVRQRELLTQRLQIIVNGEESEFYPFFVIPDDTLCEQILDIPSDEDSDYIPSDEDSDESDENNKFDVFDNIQESYLWECQISSIDTSLVNDWEGHNCCAYIRANRCLGICKILPDDLIGVVISYLEDTSDRMPKKKKNIGKKN